MPLPQVPEALAQGAIDGCVIPWEVVPSIKVDQLAKVYTQIPGSPTLYTTTFFLAMNLNRYNGLADDLKAVIAIGLTAPPIGLNVFVINKIASDVPLVQTYRGADIVRLIVVAAFPPLSLWLVHVLS
jgi:Bacterial extracellular solute-binding protein, family 7